MLKLKSLKGKHLLIFTTLILIFLVIFHASPCFATKETAQFVDEMLKDSKTEFGKYETLIYGYAMNLFIALFTCQLAWAVAQLFLQESLSFGSVITTVVRQIITGCFFYWLLFNRDILKSIIESFELMSGLNISISQMLLVMEGCVRLILSAVGKSSGVMSGLGFYLLGLSASIIMTFALTTAIGYLALTYLENYIVASLGLILLGFGGSDYTRNYALSYIRTLVHIGFKMFLISVIIMIGIKAFMHSSLTIDATSNDSISQACMRLIAQSFFFLSIVRVVPTIADTLIGGGSLGTGTGTSAIKGGVTSMASTVSNVASATWAGVSGTARSGLRATESAANAYQSSPRTGVGGKMKGAVWGGMVGVGNAILGSAETVRHTTRSMMGKDTQWSEKMSPSKKETKNSGESDSAHSAITPPSSGTSNAGAAGANTTSTANTSASSGSSSGNQTAQDSAGYSSSSGSASSSKASSKQPYSAPTPQELVSKVKNWD